MVLNHRSCYRSQGRAVLTGCHTYALNYSVVQGCNGGIDRTSYLDGSVKKAGHILHSVYETVIAQERAASKIEGAVEVITGIPVLQVYIISDKCHITGFVLAVAAQYRRS